MKIVSAAGLTVRHAVGAASEAALLAGIIVALIVALSVTTQTAPGGAEDAFAGRGGGSGPTLTFEPSTGTVGQTYTVAGSGFRANTWVTVGAQYPDTTWWGSRITDSTGSFRIPFTATGSGQILHEAKEQRSNGSLRLRVSTTLTVNPAP
jgi:IPT/TIG domain-containing protein